MPVISEKKIEIIVKRSVKEAVEAQFMRLRSLLVPDISQKEQKDIERHYGRPFLKTAKGFKLRA